MSLDNNKRENWIDIARGVAILLVILGHTSGQPDYLYWIIYGFHVPLFFVISGYLYDAAKWEDRGFKEYVCARAKAYLIPYVILSALNIVIFYLLEFLLGSKTLAGAGIATIKSFGYVLVSYGYGMPNCIQLWFLPTIFVSCILLYGLIKIRKTWIQIGVCAIAVAINAVLNLHSVPVLPWHIEVALYCVTFMYIGYILREIDFFNNKYMLVYSIAAIVLGVIFILKNGSIDLNQRLLNNAYLALLGAGFLSIGVLGVCKLLGKYSFRFLSYLGKNTIILLGINLLLNMIIVKGMGVIPRISDSSYYWAIEFLFDIVLGLLIVNMYNKLRFKIKNK